MEALQQTILKPIKFQGIGVHSGKEVTVRILPAPENTGIVFKRTDLSENNIIEANYALVVETRLCTVIANEFGAKVSTIEHILSAFWGCGIDNATVEIDGEEMAIMDGSAAPFVALISKAGIKTQAAARKYLQITKPVVIEHEGKTIELHPHDEFSVECDIEFAHAAIGQQAYTYNAAADSYNHLVSRARTFGFAKDVEQLKQMGLARGASLSNAVGIDDDGVMNPEGLRYKDEFVRHKILDCIGDLYLSGYRILGKVVASKAGHSLHNLILRKLFAEPDCYNIFEMPVRISKAKAL